MEKDVKYVAPQNDQVTVTFTKLPENPGKLSIEEITLTAEQIASLGALSDKAYDITSDMTDGTFAFDLNLPKPVNQENVQIKFAETEAGLENADTVATSDITTETDSVSASLDHFTIFVVTTPSILSDCSNAGFAITAGDKCFNSIQAAIDDSATVAGNEILVSGTFGSIDSYTVYDVTKAITIRGVNTGGVKAKVYGTFLISVDGATIDNLSITNKGISHPDKNAINLLGKQVTITNNDFNLGNGTGGVANGVVIWPYGNNAVSLNITGNTFTGYSLTVPKWSSTALLIAEQISASPFTGTPMSTTIVIPDEKSFANGNTYINNSYDYVHQDWQNDNWATGYWSYSKVSNSAGLLDSIDNSATGATILVGGTLGSTGAYTLYDVPVEKTGITLQGVAGNLVYGTFVVHADGVTITGLNIQNKGDITINGVSSSSWNRGGIYLRANSCTITNNTITNGLGTSAGIANGMQIMRLSSTINTNTADYTITGNTISGTQTVDPNASSAGILVAQNASSGAAGGAYHSILVNNNQIATQNTFNITTPDVVDYSLSNWDGLLPGIYEFAFVSKATALTDVIESARAGATINIAANISGITEELVVNRAITINGESHTLTFTSALNNLADGHRDGIFVSANGTTINNLSVVMAGTPSHWDGVYGIQFYGVTGGVVNNYTGTGADAAFLINGSAVTLNGTTTVSGNEFGGIEVSKGKAPLNTNSILTVTGTLVNTTEAYGLPTIWLVNGQGSVTGANVPATPSTTVKAGQTQYYMTAGNAVNPASIANVADLTQLTTALADSTKTTINITENISGIPATLVVPVGHPVTINGGSHTLTFTGLENVVGDVDDGFMIQAPTTINNLIVDAGLVTPTSWVGTYAIQVYNTTATLNNVTAKNGNGGILNNNSVTTLTGAINVSGNGFGGIESQGASASLNVSGVSWTNSSEVYGLPTVWEDGVTGTTFINYGAFTRITKGEQLQYYLDVAKSIDPSIAALASAKSAAVSSLATYKLSTDYRTHEQTTLADAIITGNTAINNSANTGAVATALSDAKLVIDAIKTNVQLTAEETADALADAKITAHNALATAFAIYHVGDYTFGNWTTLTGFETAGNTAITNATTLEEVTSAQTTATIGMASVVTGVVSIDGIAKYGNTLTANTSLLVNAGTPTYQWNSHWTNGNESVSNIITGATSLTYLLTSSDIGKTISVTVTAQSGVGTGSLSSGHTAIVTKATQPALNITDLPSNATYGQSGVITASTTGGNGTGAITFSAGNSSTGCTIDSSTGVVTITTGTGNCSIVATRAGDNNYEAITSSPVSITILKANQTINFVALTNKIYGNADFGVSATATSPLAVSFDSQTTGVCTINNNTVHIVSAGTCTIRATQAGDNNYSVASVVNQTFTVDKATANINISEYTGVYDGNAHGVTGTAVGIESTPADLNSLLHLGDSFTNVTGGTTHWTFDGNTNYNSTSGDVAIAISKAPSTTVVTCTGDKVYTGSALTPCTAVVTGAGGLNQSVTVTYTANINVGTVTASATFAGNSNYEGSTATEKTFEITKKPITITAVTNTKTTDGYNTADGTPTLTAGSLATGDTANFTETYDNANVGTGKTLTVSGVVSDDNSGNNYSYTFVPNTDGIILSADQIVPENNEDGSASATVDATNSEVVLTDETQAVTVDVTSGTVDPTIDVSAFVETAEVGRVTVMTGALPEITINSDVADVSIPATTVTGPEGWLGIIEAPTTGTPTGGNAPAGFSVGDTVITVGSSLGTLYFNDAVTLTLTGVTGTVGYRPAGLDTWTQIKNVCGGNYTTPTWSTGSGECAISNGHDTKILTYHFTSFGELNTISYTSGSNPRSTTNTNTTPAVPAGLVLGASTGPIQGCDSRTTGFSVATGESCIGNTGTTSLAGQVLGAASFHFTLLIKNGSNGSEIIELQNFLNTLGNTLVVDGKFGPKTKTAVIKFQIANGLKGDGVVGPITRAILNK